MSARTRGRHRSGPGSLLPGLAVPLLLASAASAGTAPVEEFHSVKVRVHASLIDEGAGEDLAYWTDQLAMALDLATLALQGSQGPSDSPCCTRIENNATLGDIAVFGEPGQPGADYAIIELPEDFDALRSEMGGAGIYLIEALMACNAAGPSILGCASLPGSFVAVGATSFDFLDEQSSALRTLGLTIAHERGHNAGLDHTAGLCDLMAASSGGGCLGPSECDAFLDKGNRVGPACSCHAAPPPFTALSDGLACSAGEVPDTCSGGMCASPSTHRLVASADASSESDELRDYLALSDFTGGWAKDRQLPFEVTGLAYDPSRDTLFAIRPGDAGGDDSLVALDPDTGQLDATVGTLDGWTNVTALAYNADADRLLAISVGFEIFAQFPCGGGPACVSTLLAIEPDTASVDPRGGLMDLIISDGVTGLAYRPSAVQAERRLWASATSGVHWIDLASCNGASCNDTLVASGQALHPSSLGYDVALDRLYRSGVERGTLEPRTHYQVFDPAALTGVVTADVSDIDLVVESFTPGGLASVPLPVPEPGGRALGAAALLTVGWLQRRRNRRSAGLR